MLGSVGKFVGLESDTEEKSFTAEFDSAVTMSRTTRLYGFIACFCGGWLITIASLFALPSIATNPERFAVLYTLGNVIALMSTFFLFGPIKQLKNMFKPSRAIATIVYLLSLALTLYLAFAVKLAIPVIIGMIVQLCAMIWYCATYVPYGREIIKKCLGGMCDLAV